MRHAMPKALIALILTVVAVVLLAGYDTHPPVARDLDTAGERQAIVRANARPRPVARRRTREGRDSVSGTGPMITTPFSVIQVRATLTEGRLTGVRTVLLSGDGPYTDALNARAEPVLRREALEARSARIDVVSGASYTSESWIDSLQAAIDAAKERGAAGARERR